MYLASNGLLGLIVMKINYLSKLALEAFIRRIKTAISQKLDKATFESYPAVLYSPQELTEEQQAQARENIGAASPDDPGEQGDKGLYYATCSTAASTTAKVADCSDFSLETGAVVIVKFTNANTASSPTLNVNSTGAKSIVKYGTTASMAYMWQTGEAVEFVYDGTNWVMIRGGLATTTYYGVTKLSSSVSSTSTSLAATPSAVKQAYDLANSKQDKISYGTTVPKTLGEGEIFILVEK